METEELLAPIADERHKAQSLAEARAKEETANRERVERAAHVYEALQTPGGKLIVEKINAELDALKAMPSAYILTEQGRRKSEVNEGLLAVSAGIETGLKTLLAWLDACGKIVDREAQRKSQ